MATTLFSFTDAVHDHLSIGFVHGCVACAQTEADMALSHKAAVASGLTQPVTPAAVVNPVFVQAA